MDTSTLYSRVYDALAASDTPLDLLNLRLAMGEEVRAIRYLHLALDTMSQRGIVTKIPKRTKECGETQPFTVAEGSTREQALALDAEQPDHKLLSGYRTITAREDGSAPSR